MFIDREKSRVEQIVEADLEADLEGESVVRSDAAGLHGLAAMEERLEQREAERMESRMGQDIELDVMHDMGLTSQEGEASRSRGERSVEHDVEAQIEQHLREHIDRGGWRARK